MIPSIRKRYNEAFTEGKYQKFLKDLDAAYNFKLKFRVAETPVFVPLEFRKRLLEASDEIIDFLVRPDYKQLTSAAIPPRCEVPRESNHTNFLALDFAVVRASDGSLIPQLIELQGFPSLFGFQDFLAEQFRTHFDIPHEYFNHYHLSRSEYRTLLTKMLIGNHEPENVILLEIDPLQQNTAIDFIITKALTGVQYVNLTDVQRDGRRLYYERNGKKIPIHRIYNRVIFDELHRSTDLKLQFNLTEDVDVEWAGHPNWFYRISKYTMPLLQSRYVPQCKFLNDFRDIPADLENYVLKPLFSFSGSGIIFNLQKSDIESIKPENRHHFLLQKKVQYEPVIQAPDGLVKTEIRLLFLWDDADTRPRFITNLARLSRGEMIGVKFNKDKTWVGGSVCFFEPGN